MLGQMPPELLVRLLSAFEDASAHQGEQCVVKIVPQIVVRPEHGLDVRMKVLAWEEAEGAAKEIGRPIPVRPVGHVLRE